MSKKNTLTTTAGAPIADNQNAITAGRHGPLPLQDYQLLEKLAHQNRKRIPRSSSLHSSFPGMPRATTIATAMTIIGRSATCSGSSARRRSSGW